MAGKMPHEPFLAEEKAVPALNSHLPEGRELQGLLGTLQMLREHFVNSKLPPRNSSFYCCLFTGAKVENIQQLDGFSWSKHRKMRAQQSVQLTQRK